jgi:hypothetical protein
MFFYVFCKKTKPRSSSVAKLHDHEVAAQLSIILTKAIIKKNIHYAELVGI